ncbi:hypothetical protein B0T13DRAFT_479459 [Neurospora crassa]|nr:hypothetical protein B0T13DRAFT_479459 [Neurospora crassa]
MSLFPTWYNDDRRAAKYLCLALAFWVISQARKSTSRKMRRMTKVKPADCQRWKSSKFSCLHQDQAWLRSPPARRCCLLLSNRRIGNGQHL